MTKTSPPAAASRPRGTRRRVIVGLVVIVGASVAGVLALRARASARLQAEIERIRLAGDPLSPADLKSTPAGSGTDATVWLTMAATARERWDLAALADPARYGRLLESARARQFGDDARVAFEGLESTLRPILDANPDPGGTWNAFWSVLAARLAECDGVPDWDAPSRAAVRLLAVGLEPAWQVARAARGVAPIDPVHVARVLDESDAAIPRLPMIEESRASDAANVTALDAALSGRGAEALEGVRAGLAMARVHSSAPFLVAATMRVHHLSRALDTLQLILPRLPRRLDTSDLEAELAAAFPRRDLAQGLRGERAFGQRVFEASRDGWSPADAPALAVDSTIGRWRVRLFGDFDHACYLEAMTNALAVVGAAAHERPPLPARPERTFLHPLAGVLVPDLASNLRLCDLIEARLALARIALTAYRAGAQDALTAISKSFDPYDGNHMRCSLGQDGLILLWSVGANQKDEDGRAEGDDVTWALRLAD